MIQHTRVQTEQLFYHRSSELGKLLAHQFHGVMGSLTTLSILWKLAIRLDSTLHLTNRGPLGKGIWECGNNPCFICSGFANMRTRTEHLIVPLDSNVSASLLKQDMSSAQSDCLRCNLLALMILIKHQTDCRIPPFGVHMPFGEGAPLFALFHRLGQGGLWLPRHFGSTLFFLVEAFAGSVSLSNRNCG